eukprot:gene6312-4542_t
MFLQQRMRYQLSFYLPESSSALRESDTLTHTTLILFFFFIPFDPPAATMQNEPCHSPFGDEPALPEEGGATCIVVAPQPPTHLQLHRSTLSSSNEPKSDEESDSRRLPDTVGHDGEPGSPSEPAGAGVHVEVDSQAHDPDFFTFGAYCRRCMGAGQPGPSWFNFSYDAIFTCIFSITTMTILATIQYYGLRPYDLGMLSYLPSFGASSTLVFYLSTSPGAQPRALILTHITGAFLGVSWSHITDSVDPPLYQLLACAFAVSMMTALMMLTNSFQPSASATTCLAALHSYGQMKDQGYMFLVTPATLGPVIIVFLGWVFNNLVPWRRSYPSWL